MALISKLFGFIRPRFEESSVFEERAIVIDVQHIPSSFMPIFEGIGEIDNYGSFGAAQTLIHVPEQFFIRLRGSVHGEIICEGEDVIHRGWYELVQNNKGKEVMVYYRDVYKVQDRKKNFHHYDIVDIENSKSI